MLDLMIPSNDVKTNMKTALPIYLDYMATTPVDPRVIAKMMNYLGKEGIFGNSHSISHIYGQQAARAVGEAREQLAFAVGALPEEIIFTSGATEADNLAIIGAAHFYQRKGRHLITMATEHKAVLDSFARLEKEGFEVSYLKPKPDGLLDLAVLEAHLRPETILVSIMQANNEIGVIQDIQKIGACLNNKGIIFHVDAAQSAGKIAIDLKKLPVHLMSFSAHKNYGPKGIGALYLSHKPRIRLEPQSYGGGHEGGLRSGTLATHQIVGMGEAFALSESLRVEEQAFILNLRHMLWDGISDLKGLHLNGHPSQRLAANLNLSFAGIEGESLLFALRELALSTTSACMAASIQPSHVLKALGLSDGLIHSSIRLSLGRFTTKAEVQKAIKVIRTQVQRLQGLSPC